jgi:hypothetical protein
VGARLREHFRASETFLHLGLTRPYAPPGTAERLCYLQVLGLYTCPLDYLAGKSLADWVSPDEVST